VRLIGQLDETLAAGVRIGEQRREPTADELRRYATSPRLRVTFRKGINRGRRRAARLQQQSLFPDHPTPGQVVERSGVGRGGKSPPLSEPVEAT
jgi:hypothetical protein